MMLVRALLLLLVLALSACASAATSSIPPATSRDTAHDRLLVTLESKAPSRASRLSISGRLDYVPPSRHELRNAQLRAAEHLASEHGLALEEDWPIPALDVHCFVFRVPNGNRRDEVIAQLESRPEVESAQPLQFFHGQAEDDDPLAEWDPHLHSRLRNMHAQATGRNVRIAVIDAGVDLLHEDLQGQALKAVDLVDGLESVPAEMHGTAVVGLLSAKPGNGLGIRGYAPGAQVTLLRACWEQDKGGSPAVCNSFTLARALSHALEDDVDIVNLSITGPRDPLLERLGAKLAENGVLVVAAGKDQESFPASVPGSILAARHGNGTGAMTLVPGNGYAIRNGTSITSAKVSATAALYREIEPGMNAKRLVTLLRAAPLGELTAEAGMQRVANAQQ